VAVAKSDELTLDSQRAIERALALAARKDAQVPAHLLAEMHVARARYLQFWLDEFRWLRDDSRLPISTPSCLSLGAFCENFANPRWFNDQLRNAGPIAVDVESRRDRLLDHFRAALELDSTDFAAALGIARELTLGSEWEVLLTTSIRVGRAQGHRFWGAVSGLALFQQGRFAESDSAFRFAVDGLADSIGRWYRSPPPGLDTIADFWIRARTLWTLPYNEPLLEYRARVTYAILAFGDRDVGVLGPETPLGDALIRYGWPSMITQFQRDMRRFNTGGGVYTNPQDQTAGRWIFWTYDMNKPSYVFERRPGMRTLRYMRESRAEEIAAEARTEVPLVVPSRAAPRLFALRPQVVRFRGAASHETEVTWFALTPNAAMGVDSSQPEVVGMFVFRDTTGLPIVMARQDTSKAAATLSLTLQGTFATGRYLYTLEARTSGTAATARGRLDAPVWDVETLRTSDLLIALKNEPPADRRPRTWRDLRLVPSRTMEVYGGTPLWIVWETYGLRPNSDGLAQYDVVLEIRDATERSLPVRLLRRLGIGGAPGTYVASLRWRADVVPAPDGRVLDYVELQLPQGATGTYEVHVKVVEVGSGREVATTRGIAVVRP
jgi:hypothetical protein